MPSRPPSFPGRCGARSARTISPSRLVSIDALRGFDLFWILGAEGVVHALAQTTRFAPIHFLAAQLEHKTWAVSLFST